MSDTQMPMNQDGNFYVAVKLIFAAFFIVIFAATSCTIHEDYQVSQMVKSGADPLTVRCAIHPQQGKCAILSAAKR